jgi:hypothetical protein
MADLELHGLRYLMTKLETTFKYVAHKKIANNTVPHTEERWLPRFLQIPTNCTPHQDR